MAGSAVRAGVFFFQSSKILNQHAIEGVAGSQSQAWTADLAPEAPHVFMRRRCIKHWVSNWLAAPNPLLSHDHACKAIPICEPDPLHCKRCMHPLTLLISAIGLGYPICLTKFGHQPALSLHLIYYNWSRLTSHCMTSGGFLKKSERWQIGSTLTAPVQS
eukprot:1161210-Pelagomonas_calceolata.AAC.19